MTEKRKFNPDGPRKKPFYDTKRKKLVVPRTCNGNSASGIDASGIPASGIPAKGAGSLPIKRKYEHLSETPSDRAEQNKLGMYLLEEIHAGSCNDTGMFAISLGLNPYKFHHMADDNEFFRDCLEIARYCIGNQLKERARTREEDGNVNMKLLPLYDQDYKRMVEELKTKEAARVATQSIVVLERIPDSPLVPILKRSEDE
jgi:hypothetical protein